VGDFIHRTESEKNLREGGPHSETPKTTQKDEKRAGRMGKKPRNKKVASEKKN